MADGSILMYNFDSQAIHTPAPGAYNLAVVYVNLVAVRAPCECYGVILKK